MDRRSLLIGSGSILTAAFVDEANWYLRNKDSFILLAAHWLFIGHLSAIMRSQMAFCCL